MNMFFMVLCIFLKCMYVERQENTSHPQGWLTLHIYSWNWLAVQDRYKTSHVQQLSLILVHRVPHTIFLGGIYFWPSNYRPSLVLPIKLKNQKSLTIQLLTPFIFDHSAVFMGGFGDVNDKCQSGPHVNQTTSKLPNRQI